MQSLLEFIQIGEMIELKDITDLLEADLASIIARHKDNPVANVTPDQISKHKSENPNNQNQSDVDAKLEIAIKRLQAARHGLGIANRLKNPEDQKKNKSRIMKNLNILRRLVQFVEEQLSGAAQQTQVEESVIREEKVADFEVNKDLLNRLKKKRESMHPADEDHKAISKQIAALERRVGGSLVKEAAISEKWATKYETPKSKRGMWDGWSKAELQAEYNKLKKSGPHKKGSKQFTRMK
jgi:hypothetical protein